MGSPQRRSFGRVRLPRNPLYGDHGIYPDAPPNARARHPLQLVGQRKDRTGSGPRHVVRRQAGPGLHEARGHERLRRRFRQFSHDGCQRRPGGRSGGRSLDALLAERTGLPLLRQIRHDSLLRTRIATGSLRDDRRGVRLLGEIPDSGADARDDPHGPLACRGRNRRTPPAKHAPLPRAAPPVDPHAGQLARTLQNPHRGEQTLRAGGRTFAPQPLHRRTGQIHGHHRLRSGLQLYYGELPGRLPLPRAEDLAISAADGTRTAHGFGVPFAADRRRGTTSGGGDDPRSAGYSDSGQRTFERRAAPHGRTHARQRTRRPRSAPPRERGGQPAHHAPAPGPLPGLRPPRRIYGTERRAARALPRPQGIQRHRLLYARFAAPVPGDRHLRGDGCFGHDGQGRCRRRTVPFGSRDRRLDLHPFGHDRPAGRRE